MDLTKSTTLSIRPGPGSLPPIVRRIEDERLITRRGRLVVAIDAPSPWRVSDLEIPLTPASASEARQVAIS